MSSHPKNTTESSDPKNTKESSDPKNTTVSSDPKNTTISSDLKKVTLKTDDGKMFEVDVAVAAMSETFKQVIDDDCTENIIPVPNIAGYILNKIIDYCNKHADADDGAEELLEEWDANFIKVDQNTLFKLVSAANFLGVKSLVDLSCQSVAEMLRNMTPEKVRQDFNIENDLTPEEEAITQKENQWAFD